MVPCDRCFVPVSRRFRSRTERISWTTWLLDCGICRRVPSPLQGELVTWPASVRERGRPPYRPVVPLWAETPSGFVHASHPIHPDDHGFEVMLRSLVEFVATDEEEALCPSRIEVRDPNWRRTFATNSLPRRFRLKLSPH